MALALGLVHALAPVPVEAGEAVDLELALGIDVSGSVDPEEARLQREGYTAALVHPEVLAAIRQGYNGRIAVMYYEWSNGDHQRIVADWTLISDLATAKAFIAKLDTNPPVIGRRTSISGAIEFAIPLFDKNDYDGTRRVIDISGDGENNAGGIVTHARDAAIAKGITINGLPIVNNRPNPWGFAQMPDLDKYYLACVIGGAGAFMIVALDFDDFARAVRRKLILEIADRTPTGAAAGERAALKPVHPRRIARTGESAFRLVQAKREEEIFPPGCLVGERRVQQFMQQRGFNP
ncbi:MAG: DUF1194 domain-containing protein [Alphaproteobacteria bacterium]|nr:DUF1194 domain-containing protein [Alphaproteobacteria bacterium]